MFLGRPKLRALDPAGRAARPTPPAADPAGRPAGSTRPAPDPAARAARPTLGAPDPAGRAARPTRRIGARAGRGLRRLTAAAALACLVAALTTAGAGTAAAGPGDGTASGSQIAGSQPANPANAANAANAAKPNRPVEVRLITGDVVRLDAAGKVAGVEPGPRADATSPRFLTRQAGGQTYVFPSDVQGLLGQQLDAELFNVTELASYGLGRDGAVPVIVAAEQSGAGPAPAAELTKLGVEVTAELEAVPASAGQADAATERGPAPSWELIEAAAEPAAPVEKIWLDRVSQVEPLDAASAPAPDYQTPPWMELIGADQAEAAGLTGKGVKVAVVDTGVDAAHPDLAGQVVAQTDFTGSGSPTDEDGHGTFVASEIAGTGAASKGVFAGVAPG
ncbi:MAG: S8 family serine peptidase, partial [Bifidobacteriaceae bacterium]|nr:S8 family serine peptidase [Bifidobacteriaceae bacterium]